MATKFDLDVTQTMELDEYQEFVEKNIDVRDLDCLHETAWALKALSNNRTFLVNSVNKKVESFLNGERLPRYTPNSIILKSAAEYIIRANIWSPPSPDPRKAALEAPLYSYYDYHDHNFHIVTVGHVGGGYETVFYEYDRAGVRGEAGEPVELRYLERTGLGPGDVMVLRGLRDIHSQHPPKDFSVSLNLLAAPAEMMRQRQFFFDVEKQTIAAMVQNVNERFATYLQFARHFANEDTVELLVDLARRHVVDSVRRGAVEQLIAIKPDDTEYFLGIAGSAIGAAPRSVQAA